LLRLRYVCAHVTRFAVTLRLHYVYVYVAVALRSLFDCYLHVYYTYYVPFPLRWLLRCVTPLFVYPGCLRFYSVYVYTHVVDFTGCRLRLRGWLRLVSTVYILVPVYVGLLPYGLILRLCVYTHHTPPFRLLYVRTDSRFVRWFCGCALLRLLRLPGYTRLLRLRLRLRLRCSRLHVTHYVTVYLLPFTLRLHYVTFTFVTIYTPHLVGSFSLLPVCVYTRSGFVHRYVRFTFTLFPVTARTARYGFTHTPHVCGCLVTLRWLFGSTVYTVRSTVYVLRTWLRHTHTGYTRGYFTPLLFRLRWMRFTVTLRYVCSRCVTFTAVYAVVTLHTHGCWFDPVTRFPLFTVHTVLRCYRLRYVATFDWVVGLRLRVYVGYVYTFVTVYRFGCYAFTHLVDCTFYVTLFYVVTHRILQRTFVTLIGFTLGYITFTFTFYVDLFVCC